MPGKFDASSRGYDDHKSLLDRPCGMVSIPTVNPETNRIVVKHTGKLAVFIA